MVSGIWFRDYTKEKVVTKTQVGEENFDGWVKITVKIK